MKKFKLPWFGLFAVIIFTVSIMSMLNYRTNNLKGVSVIDQENNYYLKTYDETVKDILSQSGITLSVHDEIFPSIETELEDGMIVQIYRAYSVTVNDGLESYQINTTARTVGEILAKENIVLDALDMVEPFTGASLQEGGQVTITRVKEAYDIQVYQIPFVTEINLVSELGDDEIIVIQEGKPGSKEVKLKLRYENDLLVARHFIDEVVLEEPINTIKNKGTDDMLVTSRGVPFRYSKVIICEATAYDLSYESCGKYPGDPAYGITYTGTHARPGTIAVDPRVIPLGSHVYIESLDYTEDYGFAIAEDTGSAIKGYKIDLFIGSNRAALRYGRRNVKVYIIDDYVDADLIKGYGY